MRAIVEQGGEERIAALWRAAPPSIAGGPAVLAARCGQGADGASGRWRTEPASKMSNTTEDNKVSDVWGGADLQRLQKVNRQRTLQRLQISNRR